MTTAAMGAIELDRCLDRQLHSQTDLTGLSDSLSKQLAQSLQAAWMFATNRDRAWLSPVDAKTTGKKLNWIDRLSKQYWQEVEALLKSSPESYAA
jgi:hypothetical protein